MATPGAANARPDSNVEQRSRGGSRPGLQRAFPSQLGSAGNRAVRMAAQVRAIPLNDNTTWESSFPLPGSPPWDGWQTYGSDLTVLGQPLNFSSGGVQVLGENVIGAGSVRNMTRSELFALDGASPYEIEALLFSGIFTPGDRAFRGTYRVSVNMSDATPNENDTGSSFVEFRFINTTPFGTPNEMEVRVFSGGSLVQGPTAVILGNQNDTIKLRVQVTGLSLAWWVNDISFAPSATIDAATGSRWGVGVSAGSSTNVFPKILPGILFRYVSSSRITGNRNFPVYSAFDTLLASDGGGIWRENDSGGDVVRVDIDPYNLAPNINLQATQRTGLLYIADTVPIYVGSAQWIDAGGGVSDGKTFDVVTGPDLVAAGLRAWDCVVFPQSSADGIVKQGTYRIASITNGAATNDRIVLEETGSPNIPFTDGGGTFPTVGSTDSVRFERPPKVYNPATDVFTHLEAEVDTDDFYGLGTDFLKGPVPCGFPLIALYRDRIVLAADPLSPHIWSMSRQGNPNDWFVGGTDDDAGRPMNSQSSFAGIIGEPITALIPFTDDYMVFGCTNSLWMLRGDPAESGQITNISDTVGVFGANSWTRTPEGHLWFLSRDGLYFMTAGGGDPESRSRDRIPQDLLNTNRATTEVFMAYDVNEQGMHVMLVPADGQTNQRGWWYDVKSDSWWPNQYEAGFLPTSIVDYESDVSFESAVQFAARDGYIRRHFFGSSVDDLNTQYSAFVVLGPYIAGGDTSHEGLLRWLTIRLGDQSKAASWRLFSGDTAEDAADQATATNPVPFASGNLGAGLNPRIRDRMRAKYWCLRIEGTDQWIYELATADVEQVGMERYRGSGVPN